MYVWVLLALLGLELGIVVEVGAVAGLSDGLIASGDGTSLPPPPPGP